MQLLSPNSRLLRCWLLAAGIAFTATITIKNALLLLGCQSVSSSSTTFSALWSRRRVLLGAASAAKNTPLLRRSEVLQEVVEGSFTPRRENIDQEKLIIAGSTGDEIKEQEELQPPEAPALQQHGRSKTRRRRFSVHPSPPQPVHPYAVWSRSILSGSCNNDAPHLYTCEERKLVGDGRADSNLYKVYQFKPGTYEMDEQLLVPENVYIIGAENPNPEFEHAEDEDVIAAAERKNADPAFTHRGEQHENGRVFLPFNLTSPSGLRPPDYRKLTLFLATAGEEDVAPTQCGNEGIEKAHHDSNTRIGFVLSSNTGIVDIAYQGVDDYRLCEYLRGGAAFETKGCADWGCGSSEKNNGNAEDGDASENVVIKNVRVNDFYYLSERDAIWEASWHEFDANYYHHPNNVHASQCALWVPKPRKNYPGNKRSKTKNLLFKNVVSSVTRADAVNFHGDVESAVLENVYMQNAGDDVLGVWGQSYQSNVFVKNTVLYDPGMMHGRCYGSCAAVYGAHNLFYENFVCRARLMVDEKSCQHQPVSMQGVLGDFGAVYAKGSGVWFKNYEFTELEEKAGKSPELQKDRGNEGRDWRWFNRNGMTWLESADEDKTSSKKIKGPYFRNVDLKNDPENRANVKVYFDKKFSDTDWMKGLKLDAGKGSKGWMQEKMAPGWHPVKWQGRFRTTNRKS